MKQYEGARQHDMAVVTVNGQPLDPRLDLCSHSPDGFEWGYAGSGPAQLALAILADCLSDDNKVLRFHQDFKRAVVASLEHDRWTLTDGQICQSVESFTNA